MNEITTGHEAGTPTGIKKKTDWKDFSILELKALRLSNYRLYASLFAKEIDKFLMKKYNL